MLPRKQRPTTNKIQGFTLIELLVVMAVMSILVGVGVNTFSIAQKKARDTKRKADLRTLKTAIEAYYVTTGSYPMGGWDNATNPLPTHPVTGPVSAGCVNCRASWSNDTNATNPDQWIAGLPTTYLSKQPKDPINTGGGHVWNNNQFLYTYVSYPGGTSTQTSYKIVTRLEDYNDPDSCYSYFKKTGSSYALPNGAACTATQPTDAATGYGALYMVQSE